MKIRKNLLEEIQKQKRAIHVVLIGTKPDIIKQAPLIKKLRERNHYTLVVHSGQHTQYNLSGGLEQEFEIQVDVNLQISGNLYEQQSQIIKKLGSLFEEIKQHKKQIIPYICADTTTAVAAGIASFANLISTAHVEAGLRTMSPPKKMILKLLDEDLDILNYIQVLRNCKWETGSYEPYPEQFDTRAAGPSAGIHFAPTSLNAQHLLSEGYAKERVFVVGNTVNDALNSVLSRIDNATIFDRHPMLALGSLIRFCIHRRENVISYQRFMSIFEAMESLVEEGRRVVFISLSATEWALKAYNLKKKVLDMSRSCKNFFYSDVIPSYIDTIALMKKCILVATDSGSIQEETNILGIPGVVLRFNTDRPESIFAGSNILAPPIKKDVILKIILSILENATFRQKMMAAPKLYGTDVSNKIVKVIEKSVESSSTFNLFELMEHERLGLNKLPFWKNKKNK